MHACTPISEGGGRTSVHARVRGWGQDDEGLGDDEVHPGACAPSAPSQSSAPVARFAPSAPSASSPHPRLPRCHIAPPSASQVDAELADVERQLAELRAEEDGDVAKEEEVEVVKLHERREATKEEEDEFEKEMQAMLNDTQKTSRPTRPAAEPVRLPSLGAVLQSGTGSRVANAVASSSGDALTLRVLRRGPKANKLEAPEVRVPMGDTLAQTVIKMDEDAQAERQRLKRQILAAAEDHEAAPRQYIAQIRQDAISEREAGEGRRGRGGGGISGGSSRGGW